MATRASSVSSSHRLYGHERPGVTPRLKAGCSWLVKSRKLYLKLGVPWAWFAPLDPSHPPISAGVAGTFDCPRRIKMPRSRKKTGFGSKSGTRMMTISPASRTERPISTGTYGSSSRGPPFDPLFPRLTGFQQPTLSRPILLSLLGHAHENQPCTAGVGHGRNRLSQAILRPWRVAFRVDRLSVVEVLMLTHSCRQEGIDHIQGPPSSTAASTTDHHARAKETAASRTSLMTTIVRRITRSDGRQARNRRRAGRTSHAGSRCRLQLAAVRPI